MSAAGGRGDDELRRLQDEVARLTSALEAEREQSRQWREVAEERRATLERFRQHPAVRLVFWVAGILLPPFRRARKRLEPAFRQARRTAGGLRALPDRLTAGRRAGALERAVEELPEPAPVELSCSLIVLTRDGRERLEGLVEGIVEHTLHDRFELVVVDNDSGPETARWIDDLAVAGLTLATGVAVPVRVVRNDDNLTFSAANNKAVATCSTDVVVLCNDDVHPISRGWLRALLAPLAAGQVEDGGEDGRGAVGVGAHLVYPAHGLLGPNVRDLGTQHLGLAFRPAAGGLGVAAGVPRAVNVGDGADPVVEPTVREWAGATAACLAVPRHVWDAVGGLDERYAWGSEDVDLCWRLRAHGRVVVAGGAVLFHHEGATRHTADPAEVRARQARNRQALADRFGPAIARAVALDRLTPSRLGSPAMHSGAEVHWPATQPVLSDRPLHVAITVTRDLPEAGYGDWMTAHELGDALAALGWRVSYVERYRDAWYDLPDPTGPDAVDLLVVLIDLYDLDRLPDPRPTTVAWIRNHPDRWTGHRWFDDYDLVLASSSRLAATVVERSRHRDVALFPLATNPDRFGPPADRDTRGDGVVFTGNHWGREDRLTELLPAVPDLVVHGKGWEDVPAVAANHRGAVAYDDLPEVYGRHLLVLDQAAGPTAGTGSVNSRVFDALATGALPVTSQVEGARELFGDELPTWSTADELRDVVAGLRADPAAASARADALRERVLAEHTYAARAARLRDLLRARVEATSFVLATSCPDRGVAETWGDWHLAWALAAELRVRGHAVDVVTMDEWSSPRSRAADVFVHLKGRSVAPVAAPGIADEGQVHVVWNISHPEELTDEECEAADLVLVASEPFADHLRGRVSTPVEVLAQATDERRFAPHATDPAYDVPVGFLGNSRYARRPVVDAALAAGLDDDPGLVIWGGAWEKFVDPRLVAATHVPNAELPRLYASVGVLLNDHWDGMRRWGHLSNRLYDALACGAVVVSDEVPGLDEAFDGAVATWSTPEDLRTTVERLLADPEERAERSRRGRAAVLARHTFAHRADELLAVLAHHDLV